MFELTSKPSLLVVCWVYHLITVSELGFFHDAWKKRHTTIYPCLLFLILIFIANYKVETRMLNRLISE